MRIDYYTEINNTLIDDLYTLSGLMEDDGEPKRVVFTMSYYLLFNKQATFFVAYKKNKKVAFGILIKGSQDAGFRRLKYFAVKRHLRNKGIGTEVLEEVIAHEANLDAGLNVACNEKKRAFYERLGFVQVTLEREGTFVNNDYIILNLHSERCDVYSSDYGVFMDIKIDEPAAFQTYRALEKQYGIKLMPEQY